MDSVGNAINTANGVKDTFSSWDKCMSKTYCKWPVIVAIIVGSLIVLSLIWCCARCLCCGAECCCGCLSCCNACCPSPRGGGRKDKGYQQGPPTSHQYQPPPPMYAGGYAGQNAGYYGGGGAALAAAPARNNLPKTAIFEDSRSNKHAKINEDALPAMPSWDEATKRRVEEPVEETDVEMDKLQPSHAQQEVGLLAGAEKNGGQNNPYGYNARDEAGDVTAAGGLRPHGQQHASPYQDYAATKSSQLPYPSSGYSSAQNIPLPASPSYYSPQDVRQPPTSPYSSPQDGRHQQTAYPSYPSSTSPQNAYGHSASTISPSPYGSRSDANIYPTAAAERGGHYSPPPPHQQQQQQSYSRAGYEPSIAAPSYRTHDVVSPVSPSAGQQGSQQGRYQAYGQVSREQVGRKPIVQQYGEQPNWREI